MTDWQAVLDTVRAATAASWRRRRSCCTQAIVRAGRRKYFEGVHVEGIPPRGDTCPR